MQTFRRHQPVYVTPDVLLPMTSDSTWRSCSRVWRRIRDTFRALVSIISPLCWGSQILWCLNPRFIVSCCNMWIHQTQGNGILVGEHEFHSISVMAHNMDGNYQIISVLWEGLRCKAYSEVMTSLRCSEMGRPENVRISGSINRKNLQERHKYRGGNASVGF